MDEYKDKFVTPINKGISIEDARKHTQEYCGLIDLCDCGSIICDECVFDTTAMTADYLFYKGYIDKAGALELILSG